MGQNSEGGKRWERCRWELLGRASSAIFLVSKILPLCALSCTFLWVPSGIWTFVCPFPTYLQGKVELVLGAQGNAQESADKGCILLLRKSSEKALLRKSQQGLSCSFSPLDFRLVPVVYLL